MHIPTYIGRCRARLSALALSVIALGLFGGCSQARPDRGDEASTVSDDVLVHYLRQQIDTDAAQDAPEASYTDYIAPQDYPAQQERMWELWRRANAERLATQAWAIGSLNALVWKIPQGEEMQLRLFAQGAKPEGGYPFFINLHGGGRYPAEPGPWTSEINEREWYTLMSFTDRYPNRPALYFVPRMADDRKGRWHYAPQRVAFRRAYQIAVLRGDADPDRVYLTGISEGGYGAFRLALYMPDYFAAIGPLAAAIEHLDLAENLRNVALRFDVGARDYEYDRSLNARDWRDKLDELAKANPGDFIHESNIIPDHGHTIPYLTMTPWLAQHKRRTYPKHISYTYYNIDDGFSDGVYYLGFGKVKHSRDARLHLDVQHEGNTFEVKSKLLKGTAEGSLTLYIDEVDFTKPIVVRHNGREVFSGVLKPSKGVMAEAIARFGDPKRVFPAKVNIPL
nr:hypothetical protein [uncultured Porphyromonas sp.]